MKLYDGGRAPNPRRVRIFLAEKGMTIEEVVQVDLGTLEHKGEAFTALNPNQGIPVLVLDDGTPLAESVAICRYLEEAVAPEPNMMGRDAKERALIEMWNRRVELRFLLQVASVFRHLHPGMAMLEVPQISAWGEANRPKVAETLMWFDAELATRPFIAGNRFTIADISLLVGVDLMKPAKLDIPEAAVNVKRWYNEVKARPSYGA